MMTSSDIRAAAIKHAVNAVNILYSNGGDYPPNLSSIETDVISMAKRFEDYIANGD